MAAPVFSVIIPTFNRARFVTCAIESVQRQTICDYEIIVIDDGSTDSTPDALRRYGKRITLVQQPNTGVSAARNRGIQIARGEWIAFLDSDDEWKPEYLARQLEVIRSQPGMVCVITNSINIDAHRSSSHFQQHLLRLFGDRTVMTLSRPLATILGHSHWYVQAVVARRDVLLAGGLFNPELSIAEDLDVIARLALEGPFAITREILVEIHRREESTPNLASQRIKDSLRASQQFQKVLDDLASDSRLERLERSELAKIRSANKRWQANVLLAQGEISAARQCYRQAMVIHPSAKSMVKYAIAILSPQVAALSVKRARASRAQHLPGEAWP